MPGPAIPIRPAIRDLSASATLLINERSKILLAAGQKVYRLGFGQSPFPVPPEMVQALREYASQKDYLPVKGLPALRTAVADFNRRRLGIDCSAEDIMIGPGSKELLLGLQMACAAELILPSPSWVSYEPQAHIVQSKVIWIDTSEKTNWLVTAEQLEACCRALDPAPRLFLLNYPSNPVGSTYTQPQLEALAQVARRHQLLVIADEIYGELTFSGHPLSLARFYPEGTIISSGLSKWCGVGGWRLGTFTFPPACHYILEAMTTIASESFSAVSAPIQYAAITAFRGSPAIENYLSAARYILRAMGQFVYRSLRDMQLTMPAPAGGFYLFPNFAHHRAVLAQNGIHTSMDLCEKLLVESGIALLPGSAFGRPAHELTCRLSYVDFDGEQLMAFAQKEDTPSLGDDFVASHALTIVEAMLALRNWLQTKAQDHAQ